MEHRNICIFKNERVDHIEVFIVTQRKMDYD